MPCMAAAAMGACVNYKKFRQNNSSTYLDQVPDKKQNRTLDFRRFHFA